MHQPVLLALLIAATAASASAAVAFNNGVSSGTQSRVANDLSQRLYEDFTLSTGTTVTGILWQQHDDTNTVYSATRVSIYSGLPEVSTLVFSSDLVATRTPNLTGTILSTFNGFDYSLGGLSLTLPAGTYWIGLNTLYTGGLGTGWDNTLGGPDTISGARIINTNFAAPGTTYSANFAFQIVAVPEPSTYLLLCSGLAVLAVAARRGQGTSPAPPSAPPAPYRRPTQ